MKPSFVFLMFSIIVLCSSSTLVRSQNSCASNILNVSGILFDTTSLRCVNVWEHRNFILRYGQVSPNLWSFVLSYSKNINSYGAIGFSKDGNMVGSSAIVGWLESAGVAGGMKQYYLGGKEQDQVVPDKGDLQWTNASMSAATSIAYMAFQLQSSEPPPYLIFAMGPNGSFPSAPSFLLSLHSHKHSFNMDYASGPSPSPAPAYNYKTTKVRLHRRW